MTVQMPDDVREACERVLSDKELAAFVLSWRGSGYRSIARVLGVAPTTVRDRVARSNQKIAQELLRKGEHSGHTA
jgi:DNA-directed RNA polymerase specialized sigma24 family protein